MFYKNIPTSTRRINYQLVDLLTKESFNLDNNVKNSNVPSLCVNINNETGVLKSSYGDERFNCYINSDSELRVYPEIADLSNIIYVKFFVGSKTHLNDQKKQIIALTSDYKMYISYLDDGSTNYLELFKLTNYCDYRFLDYCYQNTNYLIMSTKYLDSCISYIYKGYGDVPMQISNEYFIFDICNHNDMMFLVLDEGYRNKILFGSNINPLNLGASISSMESITVPSKNGKILKLISCNDYIYVICEFGIMRVELYVSQKTPNLEEIYFGTGKIVEKSIEFGADSIMFADEFGIYVFNGNSVEKIKLNFESLFKDVRNHKGVACFVDNKYYFATKLNYFDDIVENYNYHKNNSLIVYDILSKRVELCCDISIEQLECYQDGAKTRIALLSSTAGLGQLYTLSNSSGLYDYDNISKKIYESGMYDLNKPNKTKILRYLYITTDEDIKLIVSHDGKKTEYTVKGDTEQQKIAINIKANEFGLKVISETQNIFIKSIKLMVGIYE